MNNFSHHRYVAFLPHPCFFLTTAVVRKKHGCGRKATYLWWEKLFISSRLVSVLSGCSLSQVYCQFSLWFASAVPAVQWSMSRYELELVLRARIYIMCPFLSLSQFPLKKHALKHIYQSVSYEKVHGISQKKPCINFADVHKRPTFASAFGNEGGDVLTFWQ